MLMPGVLLEGTFITALCLGALCSATAAQEVPKASLNPFHGRAAAVDFGRKLFNGTCAVCHGVEASGGRGPALNTGQFPHGGDDAELFETIKRGIASGGMPSFAALPDADVWQLVTFLKSLSRAPLENDENRPQGSETQAASGRNLFFAAGSCADCHEAAGAGHAIGPDLSALGRRGGDFIRAALTRSVHAASVVELRLDSGELVRGIPKSEDAQTLLLLTLTDTLRRIERGSVRSRTRFDMQSPGSTLSADQIDALVAFLSRQSERLAAQPQARYGANLLAADRIVNAGNEPQNWPTYWGDYAGRHFSPLTEINQSNVYTLQARWETALPGPALLEATPLVVDGVMYVSGSPGEVYALDAKTGLLIWKFSRKQDVVNPYQINPYNRGVAVLDGRVFVGTLDDLVIAIDAHTGRELWERRIADTRQGYTITGAPLAIKDRIVVGVGCGEYGVRGFIEALDPATGKRVWRRETIPGPGEAGHSTWPGESWQHGGGGTWLTGSYDAQLDVLYWAVGNPAPYNNWQVRKGDNLYTDSVLALDPQTGALKWSYQFTPNDSHDWDSTEDLVLADRLVKGKLRKLLIHADRNGFLYTLDRTNGTFISGRAFVHQTWNAGFDAHGRPRVRAESKATPAGRPVFPTGSATNFQAPSFDPNTGTLFLVFRDAEGFAAYGPADYEPGKLFTAPSLVARPAVPAPLMTGIRALATDSGDILWTYRLPRFAPQAGVLATAGGILFAGTAEGSMLALNKDSGQPLWSFRAGGQIYASPISYAIEGRQFIALAAGNFIYSFALPQQR